MVSNERWGEQRKTHPNIVLRTVIDNGTEPKCVRDRKKEGEKGHSLPALPIPTALKGAYSEKSSPPDVSLERIRAFTSSLTLSTLLSYPH